MFEELIVRNSSLFVKLNERKSRQKETSIDRRKKKKKKKRSSRVLSKKKLRRLLVFYSSRFNVIIGEEKSTNQMKCLSDTLERTNSLFVLLLNYENIEKNLFLKMKKKETKRNSSIVLFCFFSTNLSRVYISEHDEF